LPLLKFQPSYFNPNFHEFPDVSHITFTTAEFSPMYSLIYVCSRAVAQSIFQTSTELPPDVNQIHRIPILHPVSHFGIQLHLYCY